MRALERQSDFLVNTKRIFRFLVGIPFFDAASTAA